MIIINQDNPIRQVADNQKGVRTLVGGDVKSINNLDNLDKYEQKKERKEVGNLR